MSDPSKKQMNAPVKQVVQPCPKPTIDLQYLDCKGNGIAGANYQLYSVDVNRAKDGFYEKSGTLDSNGLAHISDVPELVGFVYYFEKDPKTYEPEEKPSKKPELAKAQSVLDSIGDWLVGAAQGDFNKEQTTGQLVANTLLGLVPIVDQVLDARDIVSVLKDIVEYYMEDEASQKSHPDELGLDYELWIWINVFIIAIGCIPIVGSAVKGVLKGVLHYLKKAGKVATKLSPHQLRIGWEYLVAILNKFGVGNAHQWLKTEFPSKIDGWMKEASGIIKRGLDSIMESADTAVKGVKFFSTEKAALVAKRVEEYKKAINKAKSKVDEMSSKVKQWFKEQIGAITGGAHKSEHIGATGTKSNPVTNSRNQSQADAPDVPSAKLSRMEKLAAETGNTAAHVLARRQVATNFYKQNAKWMTDADINDHLKGIDFNNPVVVKVSPPPVVVEQWQVPGDNQGNYYSNPGTSPGELGIGPYGVAKSADGPSIVAKVTNQYQVPAGTPYLQSTSASITDTWSVKPGQFESGKLGSSGMSQQAQGGGTQMFMPSKPPLQK